MTMIIINKSNNKHTENGQWVFYSLVIYSNVIKNWKSINPPLANQASCGLITVCESSSWCFWRVGSNLRQTVDLGSTKAHMWQLWTEQMQFLIHRAFILGQVIFRQDLQERSGTSEYELLAAFRKAVLSECSQELHSHHVILLICHPPAFSILLACVFSWYKY